MATIDITVFREHEEQGLVTCRSHPQCDLVIWNYTPKCQWERAWDDVTMQARGLITKPDGTIVSRCMKKFFNYEEYQGTLPLEPFKITEKLDGSLGILYFVDNEPYIATRGSFTSKQAIQANRILQEKFGALRYLFKRNYSYLFEIIYPINRIVVDYGSVEDLVLLTIFDTETGEEFDVHDPALTKAWPELTIVKHYDGISDIAELRKLEKDNQEGFVIRFESGLRLKMKFAEYVRLHRLLTQINARVIWDLLRNNQPFDELLERVPDEFYQWVATTRDNLLTQFKAIEARSREVYEEIAGISTRKEQAAIITKAPYTSYAAVVFRMLDGKDYQEIIWKQIKPEAERPFREDIDV